MRAWVNERLENDASNGGETHLTIGCRGIEYRGRESPMLHQVGQCGARLGCILRSCPTAASIQNIANGQAVRSIIAHLPWIVLALRQLVVPVTSSIRRGVFSQIVPVTALPGLIEAALMSMARHNQEVIARRAHDTLPQRIVAMHRMFERFCRCLIGSNEEVVLAKHLDAMNEVVRLKRKYNLVGMVRVDDCIWEALFRGVLAIKSDDAVAGVDARPGFIWAFEVVLVPETIEQA